MILFYKEHPFRAACLRTKTLVDNPISFFALPVRRIGGYAGRWPAKKLPGIGLLPLLQRHQQGFQSRPGELLLVQGIRTVQPVALEHIDAQYAQRHQDEDGADAAMVGFLLQS